MAYPCTGCGACCKRAATGVKNLMPHSMDPTSELYFPYKCDETGCCEMLSDDNRCTVYENRPLICSVDKMAEIFGKEMGATKEEYYEISAESCNSMIEEDNLPEKFKVIIKNQ